MEGEGIFASHVSDEGLIKYMKNSYSSVTTTKWAKDMNRYFSKEDI